MKRGAAITIAFLLVAFSVSNSEADLPGTLVRPPQKASLRISPATTVIGVGGKLQGLWAVYDTDGPSGPALEQYIAPSQVFWSSSNPRIASVSGVDGIKGRSPGIATISGKYKGLSASVQVTVAGELNAYSLVTPDGRTRSYLLFIPSGYRSGTSTPLVLAFHGGGGTGQTQMDITQMNAVAEKNTVLVAYPNGTSGVLGLQTWNGGTCCGHAADANVDDVTFVRLMIQNIGSGFTLDERRVYATGMSNGGIFSHRLACELSDMIAAIAPMSGGINLNDPTKDKDFSTCTPSRPVSIIEFHGTTDENYPYFGGVGPASRSGVDFYPIPQTISDWLVRDGIPANTMRITYQEGIETCETYASTIGTEVTLCTAKPPVPVEFNGIVYDGGGHAVPGGVRGTNDKADIPTQDIISNEAIWEFFKNHPMIGGTIHVSATLNGIPWAGSVTVDYSTPNGTFLGFTLSTGDYTNQPSGTYAVTYKSGGPPGAILRGATYYPGYPRWPTIQYILKDGGTIEFRFDFTTNPNAYPPGDYTHDISGWTNRPYTFHVPPGYDGLTPRPVVLALHGAGGSGLDMARLTCPNGDETNAKCLNKLADRKGFIVVYPDGTADPFTGQRTWNGGGGKKGYECVQGYACAHNIDDIKYVRDLLGELKRAVAVDPSRVYATGISNGAVMSQRLACELSDQIAAIAPVSGVNQFSAVAPCNPSHPVPVVEFHGTADVIAPYDGGRGLFDSGIRVSVAQTITDWVDRNSCSNNPTKEKLPDIANDGTSVTKESYSQCRENADVILYTINGGGHTWPDGQSSGKEGLTGKTTHNINANQVIWEFFKNHPRM